MFRVGLHKPGADKTVFLVKGNSTGMTREDLAGLADHVLDPQNIGAGPASGSFKTQGMVIVPCSMKTVAGIHSGYTDNLILRAADVTLKEQRPLVLAARETPMSAVHLKNLYELSMIPGVRIMPPMMTFYSRPKTIDDMVYHMAAKLLEPLALKQRSTADGMACNCCQKSFFFPAGSRRPVRRPGRSSNGTALIMQL